MICKKVNPNLDITEAKIYFALLSKQFGGFLLVDADRIELNKRAYGRVYGNEKFIDGTSLTTSPVVSVNEYDDGLIETKNSFYVLLTK